ncbi:MAG: Ku protein [Methanomicrobiales archaeon]
MTDDEGDEIRLSHPVWRGDISLGLVRVPVRMITITRDHRIHFRKIHRRCGTPIHYRQVCEKGETVPREEIVYGYEVAKGAYITLEEEEIDEARPATSETVRLTSFVRRKEVDPHYFDRTYLLVPDEADDAYALLLAVMEKTDRGAVGKVSMFSREYVVFIHPYEGALVATILHYDDELQSPRLAPGRADLPKPSGKELEIASGIVEKMTEPFDLSIFEDTYRDRLKELIQARIEGREAELEEREQTPSVRNLMEALQQTARALE